MIFHDYYSKVPADEIDRFIAAQEMGGTLSAFSDGADKGACFTLELPACRAMHA